MRASILGSMRRVMVIDSVDSLAAATAGGCKPAAVERGPVELTGPGITAVRGDLAAVNIGSADGLRRGQAFMIHRGETFVAYLRIDEVAENSGAGIVHNTLLAPVRGDRITRLVKSPGSQKAVDKGRIRGHVAAVKGEDDLGPGGQQLLAILLIRKAQAIGHDTG